MYLVYLVGILTLIGLYIRFTKKERAPPELRKVPVVAGSLPVVGHGLQTRDLLGFIRRCYHTYGKVFRIKLFTNDIVVVCDRDLIKEYFGAKENEMSLYDVLERLYFVDAFTDNPSVGSQNILIIKNIIKKIGSRYKEFVPKIISEAKLMTLRLNATNGSKVKLSEEMIRFVSNTSAKCFTGYSMSDTFYYYLMKFAHLQNNIVILTYFAPKFVIRMTIGRLLAYYRHQMVQILKPEIKSYRDDPTMDESFFIRSAVDYTFENGTKYNDDEIADLIVCLLYVSSENTALGVSAAITELSRAPDFWNRTRDECKSFIKTNDLEGLMRSPLLDAVVMESARLNSHMFAMNRKPIEKKVLGDYWIGDCSAVALCEPMLMKFECADDTFHDATEFNPDRFMGKIREPKVPSKIMTWGSGIHLCPGKKFAIYEIKAAVAMITTHFAKPEISAADLGELNYFSPSAFAERETYVTFNPTKSNEKYRIVEDKGRAITIKTYGTGDERGYLIRGLLSEKAQSKLLDYTLELAKTNPNLDMINDFSRTRAFPIAYYNLAYTGTSTCAKPMSYITLASYACEFVKDHVPEINFNSVYCQLFSDVSRMDPHRDSHVGFGVSISIGDTADFTFGDKTIQLVSGDIFIADFSKVEHSIRQIHKQTAPDFYASRETWGRTRLSVQVREVEKNKSNEPKMTDRDFVQYLSEITE